MYRFLAVTDPDTASGFRLAGVEVIEAADPAEAARVLPALIARDDAGILAVNEDFLSLLSGKDLERVEKSYRPIILPIPSRAPRMDRTRYMEGLLRRAIGYNIVLRR